MADEMVSVATLSVNTDKAVKNVAELKDYIKFLKEQINDTNTTLDENKEYVGALTQAQNQLKDIMHTSALTAEELHGKLDLSNATYNDLVHTLAELKKAWRSTADEQERSKLANAINAVNEKLKGLDESVGSYKRNVGNYANSIASISGLFGQAGGTAKTMANGVNLVTNGFKAMSATPVIAILGAIITLFDKLKNSLKSSEDNINAVTIAFAPFKSVSDLVTRTMQYLAQSIAKVGEGLTWVLDKLGLISDAMKARQAEAKESIQLEQDRRRVAEENAVAEGKIAELRAKMAEKDKYSEKERLAFAEQWKKELMGIEERNLSLAKRELALAEAESKHSGNSREANEALSQARIKVTQATTQYNEQLRRVNAEIATLTKSEQVLVSQSEKVKEHFEVYANWAKEMDAATDARIKAQQELNKEFEDLYQETYDAIGDEFEKFMQEQENIRQWDLEREKEQAEAKKALWFSYGEFASSTLDSIADTMESNEDLTQKQLNAVKAMRIGSATIDTISGAISAYMQCMKDYPSAVAPIIGALQASMVTATGMAQIAKIKSTRISKSGGTSGVSTAIMTTPSLATQIPTTFLQTTQTQEETMAQGQRVTLVYSDIETANSRRVDVTNESSF